MNESGCNLKLADYTDSSDCWGRSAGRTVYKKLVEFVERNPGMMVFRISIDGTRRVDFSFASETIIELAWRYRGSKGFCFVDLANKDMIENWDAAASRREQPIISWHGDMYETMGPKPSPGNQEAFDFAMARDVTRASEFWKTSSKGSLQSASMKFKLLAEQGFLLRRGGTADTGGLEFQYHRIK